MNYSCKVLYILQLDYNFKQIFLIFNLFYSLFIYNYCNSNYFETNKYMYVIYNLLIIYEKFNIHCNWNATWNKHFICYIKI